MPSASAGNNEESSGLTEVKECLIGRPALLLSAVVEHKFNDDGLQGGVSKEGGKMMKKRLT